ncbi:MAG: TetR/AcrR family transcriptional regulator [Arenibacter sp.]|nr:TetR/AcrR family transcriptional regulator [Arenibacter sp.]
MNKQYIDSGRKKQKLKTRNTLLKTTQKLLANGNDFSLEDVAKKAKVSRATIYRYYSNIDVLSAEAGLDLNTESPETIINNLKHLDIQEQLVAIQAYFNQLTVDHEAAFRKYLSIVLASDSPIAKRGARRPKTLQMALAQNNLGLDEAQCQNLIHIATVLMGIEAFVVTNDVCGLSKQDAMKTLQWGLEMVLHGIMATKL